MNKVRLSIIDAAQSIQGSVDRWMAETVIAALSAEPETIAEMEKALGRYIKSAEETNPLVGFRVGRAPSSISAFVAITRVECLPDSLSEKVLDPACPSKSILIVDLPARMVVAESSYSLPSRQGQIQYQRGEQATEILLPYWVPHDWLFLSSLDAYEGIRAARINERVGQPPLDVRSILYGSALLDFIRDECLCEQRKSAPAEVGMTNVKAGWEGPHDPPADSINNEKDSFVDVEAILSMIHARWLITSREDLFDQAPRDVLLAKREFLDFDLHTRELQWSLLGEGPPCLPQEAHAFRFAGFGTHEWVVYYDLVRHLLRECWWRLSEGRELDREMETARLEVSKRNWLGLPRPDYDDRIPALIIENERRRFPIAMAASDVMIDEECPACQAMFEEVSLGVAPCFWHLDSSHFDEDFAFSCCRTIGEWEAERRRWEEFRKEFDQEWEENKGQFMDSESLGAEDKAAGFIQ